MTHRELYNSIRSRIADRSKPIYTWGITDDEFFALQGMLYDVMPGTAQGLTADSENKASMVNFLIWCSEYYRRNLAPSATWADILRPIRCENIAGSSRASWIEAAEIRLGNRPPLDGYEKFHKRIYVEGGLPVNLLSGETGKTYMASIKFLVEHCELCLPVDREKWKSEGLQSLSQARAGGVTYWPHFFDLAWDFSVRVLENVAPAFEAATTAEAQITWLFQNAGLGLSDTPEARGFLSDLLTLDRIKARTNPWWPKLTRVLELGNRASLEIHAKHRDQIDLPVGFAVGLASQITISLGRASHRTRTARYNKIQNLGKRIGSPALKVQLDPLGSIRSVLTCGKFEVSTDSLSPLELEDTVWVFTKREEQWQHLDPTTKLEFPLVLAVRDQTSCGQLKTVGLLEMEGCSRLLVEVPDLASLPSHLIDQLPDGFPSLIITPPMQLARFFWQGSPIDPCIGWPRHFGDSKSCQLLFSESFGGDYRAVNLAVQPSEPEPGWFRIAFEDVDGALHVGPRRRLVAITNFRITQEKLAAGWKIQLEGRTTTPCPTKIQQCSVDDNVWGNLKPGQVLAFKWGRVTFRIPSPEAGAAFVDGKGELVEADLALGNLNGCRIQVTGGDRDFAELEMMATLHPNFDNSGAKVFAEIRLMEIIPIVDGEASMNLPEFGDHLLFRLFTLTNELDAVVRLQVKCNGQEMPQTLMIRRVLSDHRGDPRYFLYSPYRSGADSVMFDEEHEQIQKEGGSMVGIWIKFPTVASNLREGSPPWWQGLHRPEKVLGTKQSADIHSAIIQIMQDSNLKNQKQKISAYFRQHIGPNQGGLNQEDFELFEASFKAVLEYNLPPTSLWLVQDTLLDDVALLTLLSRSQFLRDHWSKLVHEVDSPLAFDWRLVRPSVFYAIADAVNTEPAVLLWFGKELKESYGPKLNWAAKKVDPQTGVFILRECPAFVNQNLKCDPLRIRFEASFEWRNYSGRFSDKHHEDYHQAMIWIAWFTAHATREEYNEHISRVTRLFKQMECIFKIWKYSQPWDAKETTDGDWFQETYRLCIDRAFSFTLSYDVVSP